MTLARTAALLLLAALPWSASAQEVSGPAVVLRGVPFDVSVSGAAPGAPIAVRSATGAVLGGSETGPDGTGSVAGVVVGSRDDLPLSVVSGGSSAGEIDPTLTPGWFSLAPPLVAIVLALLFKEVITALVAGVWLGALAVAGFDPITGTWRLIDGFIVPALADTDGGHTQVVVFSLLLGGMVGVISRAGGSMGIVEAVTPYARTPRRGKLATWLAGMAIFFDDYANTLIVGNSMRPITDRLRISREKLAYLVDSTAAPIAALVPISTWVGYEIGLIQDGLRIAAEQTPAVGDALGALSPFDVFVQTIPYRFYPVLALYFALLTCVTRRDFGPMAAAEDRARVKGELHRPGAQLMTDTSADVMEAKPGAPHRWWNAALPVLTVVLVVLAGLFTTGRAAAGPEADLSDVFGAADPFVTLLWGSLAGCIVALGLAWGQRILSVQEGIDAWMSGMRAMLLAMVILVLAWSMGSVTGEIGTAEYLAQILEGSVAVRLLPVLVFVTAAAMSFATGTSWGTMGILLPLTIPLTVALGGYGGGGAGDYSVLLGTISSVLAGAIFGDHCSPISDTTVLSSTASGCDHVDHVRTQLPYAVLVAVVGMLLGDIGTAYGLPVWVALPAAMAVLYGVLRWRGTVVEADGDGAESAAP